MKKKPIKINLKFEFYEDDPMAKEIGETFNKLMETLNLANKEKYGINKTNDKQ